MFNKKDKIYIIEYINQLILTTIVAITLLGFNSCQVPTLDENNSTKEKNTNQPVLTPQKPSKDNNKTKKSQTPKDNNQTDKKPPIIKPKPYFKPIARSDIFIVDENSSSKFDILKNDTYFDKKDLKIEIIQKPKYGTLDKNLIYTPITNYNGYDEFIYKISDLNNSSTTKSYISIYNKKDSQQAPIVQLPKTSISSHEIAIIINSNDSISKKIGLYYAKKRGIPNQNIVYVKIPNNSVTLSAKQFAPIIKQVKNSLPNSIQAYVLTWIKPFKVEGMSITSAFAFGGYDKAYDKLSGGVCSPTKSSLYFNSESTKPFDDYGIRPTMVLAGVNENNIKTLIDRGVLSDYTMPTGTGYFIRTTDSLRSVRYFDFKNIIDHDQIDLEFEYIDNSKKQNTNTLQNKNDILFYFTGLANVANIDTNSYLPGAIADHLTSFGGNLTATPGKGQMSAIRWLEAGATGSFGTVKEPCNYTQKFPMASIAIKNYFLGNSLIEAYWKSVKWPGEGIFIGEPLAKPWGKSLLEYKNNSLIIKTTWLKPYKEYSIVASNKMDGNFIPIFENITTNRYQITKIVIPNPKYKFYKLVEN